jgi:hypothetical protein
MFFYPKSHKIYQGHLKPLTDKQLRDLRENINQTLKEPKYLKRPI